MTTIFQKSAGKLDGFVDLTHKEERSIANKRSCLKILGLASPKNL